MTGKKIALLLLFFFCTPYNVPAELVDRSVAIVNNDIITLSEVNELGQPLFQKAASEVPPEQLEKVMDQIRTSVIQKLIDKKLLLQEAGKMQITISEPEVDNALKRILLNNKITREQFVEELKTIGMTEPLYREDLKGQILRSKLVNYEVRSKVIIPEEKIIDYYDLHYTEQVGEGGYYILQIGTSRNATDASGKKLSQKKSKEKIAEVHGLAQHGGNFKELARQYSDLPSAKDGGDIGIFQVKEMAPFMRNAIVGLKPGQISKIVETPSGYQFFSILSSQEGQIITKVPYESVKEEIREKLYQQEMQLLYKNWIEGIRDKAYIKIL
jgi:peptidyl-prolyl cis-trans isomerase SurA